MTTKLRRGHTYTSQEVANALYEDNPGYAAIDAASSGDNSIVAAVPGAKIRVLAVFLMAASAVAVRFESGAGGTALTGQMNVAANGGFVMPYNPAGWFETAVAAALNLELGGNVSVDGCIVYKLVQA